MIQIKPSGKPCNTYTRTMRIATNVALLDQPQGTYAAYDSRVGRN